MKDKIIQIFPLSCSDEDDDNWQALYVLTEKGKLYLGIESRKGKEFMKWTKINLPDEEE